VSDELFVRPFLARSLRPLAQPESVVDDVGVRPYYLTQGRTRTADERIGYETLVISTLSGFGSLGRLTTEKRHIIAMATAPVSIAELSAGLRVPIGVAKVLAGDMAAEGLLELHGAPTAPNHDISLIARLINGVRSL